MYYYGARWYDPTTGRFISQDPFAGRRSNPQSLNPYIYVLDTPTSLTDPSGEEPWYIEFLESLGPGNSVINISEHVTGVNTDRLVGAVLGPQAQEVFTGSRVLSGGAFLAMGVVAAGAVVAPVIGIGGASLGSGTASVANLASKNLADLATKESLTPGATSGLIDTSSFFSTADLTANIIDSNTLVGLDNGVPVPSASVPSLVRAWLGSDAASGPSGTGIRYFSEVSEGVLRQARVDYGQIGQQQGVYRVVLETYVKGEILFKMHLPIIG